MQEDLQMLARYPVYGIILNVIPYIYPVIAGFLVVAALPERIFTRGRTSSLPDEPAKIESERDLVALQDIIEDMSKDFAVKMESNERELITMQDYIQDVHPQMSKLTKDVNMLKETRNKASIIR
jgi:hypothetical protein